MFCRKYVLPKNKLDIVLNENGVCNICVDFQSQDNQNEDGVLLESELIKILNKYKDFPGSIKETLDMAHKRFKSQAISPHWFCQYDPGKIREILERELKWEAPKVGYHIEISKLIRPGEVSREEALNILEIDFEERLANSVLDKIGCSLDS